MTEIFGKAWFKAVMALAAAAALAMIVYTARQVLTPFVISLGLAYILDPLVDRLEARKYGRNTAVAMLVAAALLLITLGFLMIAPLVIHQVEFAARNMPVYIDKLANMAAPLIKNLQSAQGAEAGQTLKESLKALGDLPGKALNAAVSGVWSGALGAMGVLAAALNMAIIPVVTIYLLVDFDLIVAWAALRVPPKNRTRVYALARKLDGVLSGFFRGQFIVAMIMSSIYSVGLLIIGAPMGFFIGALAGLANIVPFMPVVVGYIPAMALALASGDGWLMLAAITGLFGAGQALEGLVITPRIQGQATGLHPVAIMAATLVGGVFFGLIGVLLAAPTAAVIKVLLEELDAAYLTSDFYNSRPGKKRD